MNSTSTGTGLGRWRSRVFGSFCAAFAAWCLAFLVPAPGCSDIPLFPPPDGTTNDNGDGDGNGEEVTASIVNFLTNFPLSALDEPISVVYSVTGTPEAVSGLYVRVADSSAGAGELGDRVVFITGLAAGANQAFNFDPAEVAVGNYRVGVRVTVGGEIIDALSLGAIQVQGPPDPVFHQPVDAITEVTAGTAVQVSFDAGDPEGDVQWRLFFTTASDSLTAPPDQLGTELTVGTGNFGEYLFPTAGRDPGDYMLGLSATDTGLSISGAASAGDLGRIITIGDESTTGPIIRVLEEHVPVPPTISVLTPGAGGIELFMDEAFTIQLAAFVGELGATGQIELFYDSNADIGDGFSGSIASGLPVSTSSYALPTDLPAGTYFIGAKIDDGVSPVVSDYSEGTLTIVRTPYLTVSEPSTNMPLTPSTPGAPANTIAVVWSTNVPESAGTLDVYAQTVDSGGTPFGAEIQVLPAGSTKITSALFSSDTSGLYAIFVRITYNEQLGLPPLIQTSPQEVRVSSLPAILWLGSLAEGASPFDGVVFEGANFEDNAGTSFSPVADLNDDGVDEFMIGARYGKAFFTNPMGVGPGEAYLIYGSPIQFSGVLNLNSVGTSLLTGVTFVGIRTRQDSNDSDGMSSLAQLPDLDGDGKPELIFGFPNTDSRGHNIDPEQDGVVETRSLSTLEREDQFLRGGVVIVNSRNSILGDPENGTPVISLDLVGQDFVDVCVGTPADSINYGFVKALARDFCHSYVYSNCDIFFGGNFQPCGSVIGYLFPCECELTALITSACEPSSPGLHRFADETDAATGLPLIDGRSAFYPMGDGNEPVEPFGARLIGVGVGDEFGTSVTLSNALGTGAGDIIVSAPARTARGILMGPNPGGCDDPTECGGEIDGLTSGLGSAKTNTDSGVAYLFELRDLWTHTPGMPKPPKPHQFIVGEASHCGGSAALIDNIDAVRIAGDSNDKITNILGIPDFNGDTRNDFLVGAPGANAGQGRVYVGFRREQAIEGDYVLEKLGLAQSDPERLDGLLIVSSTLAGLGSSLATDFDFNGDGVSDLVIGSPRSSGGVGEVIVLFGQTGVTSGENGISVTDLLQTERTADGRPVAARITGNPLDSSGQFGFNVANAGDIDGDGLDDLLIAAPNATPRFDPDPTDSVDELTAAGVDVDFNGVKDDVSGPQGVPDGFVDANDDLVNAGVVYVIFGRNRLDQIPNTGITIGIEELGTNQLAGFIIAGRRGTSGSHLGDRIGGGDAGDITQGGIGEKLDRGRSHGLGSAGDVDGDGRADILIGSILADPRLDPNTGLGVQNGGEAYLIYGSSLP